MEYLLKYLGKKAPVKIERFGIVFGADPVWVQEPQYTWLTTVNPKMFQKIAERQAESEPVIELVTVKEPDPPKVETPVYGVCEKCGQEFKAKWTYDRHIKRCTGPEQ